MNKLYSLSEKTIYICDLWRNLEYIFIIILLCSLYSKEQQMDKLLAEKLEH
jgi:hypothetical protein